MSDPLSLPCARCRDQAREHTIRTAGPSPCNREGCPCQYLVITFDKDEQRYWDEQYERRRPATPQQQPAQTEE